MKKPKQMKIAKAVKMWEKERLREKIESFINSSLYFYSF